MANSYLRDVEGRLISFKDAQGNTISYTYDENGYIGQLTTLTYPDGKEVFYAYDELNRLKTLTNLLGQTATYNYDEAGRLDSLINFNGTVTTYTHDDANRLTGIDSRATDSSVIAAFFYTLDENGNRIGIDKQLPLTATLPVRNETAVYTHNRLNNVGNASFSHDDEGQLASKEESGITSYIFDDAHWLTEVSGTSTDQYFYDGANRLRALRDSTETRYIYDSGGNLLAEADSTNAINRYYIHGMGLLAAITPTDETFCYHYDGLGSTAAITDMGQNVVNAYSYAPFGSIVNETEFFSQPFKYVGKLGVMAEENGLYYMRARYYDPVIGRFISEDPLGFNGGDVNLYVYTANNPVLFIDPLGLLIKGRNDTSLAHHAQGISAKSLVDSLGGEQMLINTRDGSLIVAGATSYLGIPATGFVATGGIAEGLRTSIYSNNPYRDVLQTAVLTLVGVKNTAINMLLGEGVNQANRHNDSINSSNASPKSSNHNTFNSSGGK